MAPTQPAVVLIAVAAVSLAAAGQTPPVGEAERAALVRGNTQFALDLYAELCGQTQENVLVAPQSISTALAMTYAGARGETAEQMRRTLHFDLEGDRVHAAFADLTGALTGFATDDASGSSLLIANRVWAADGEPLLPSYLETIRRHYAGGVETADFRRDAEAARLAINDWTARRTSDRIKELFQRAQIDRATALVLVNAVYFNGTWRIRFDPDRTREGAFHAPGRPPATVPMMNMAASVGCFESDLLQAVRLPYAGDRLEMVILLPATREGLPRLEAALTADNLAAWLGGLSPQTVQISLPRFDARSRFELSSTLAGMGMPDAFSAAADFSGINGRRGDLFISTVVHDACIAVDEEGTEAAAATGVAMKRDRPRVFAADHPFLFLIRDPASGSVVFLGRITRPGAAGGSPRPR